MDEQTPISAAEAAQIAEAEPVTAPEAAQPASPETAEAELPAAPSQPAPALSAASRALPKKPPAPKAPAKPTTATVVDVRFQSGGKVYFFDPGKLVIPAGAHIIIDTARGPEYGTCTAGNHTVPIEQVVQPLRPVLRVATLQDEKAVENNRAREGEAFEICSKKILEHGLEMKLVSVEYAFDGSKILFFFTADGRVDFRELVKDLASVFRTRIELRQIGVRDEAKMLGGLGICGRPFCCAQFLDDFQPVSIKMAKTQNLSLNPTKISGACGRLMCCLKYEQDAYEDLLKTSPKAESFVDTPDGRGTVTDVNLLRQQVNVRMEDDPTTIKCYRNCEICILRNGKAKKNDPPIPKDLAPISSAPRPVKPEPEEDSFMLPEPVLISQFQESLLQETAEETGAPSAEQQSRPNQKQNRRRDSDPSRPEHETREGRENRQENRKGGRSENRNRQQPRAASGSQQGERSKSGQSYKKRNNYRRNNYRRNKSGGQERGGNESE